MGDIPWPTALFAAFTYDRGLVFGTYTRFAYNATSGIVTTVSGVAGDTQVPYLGSIAIDGFPPARSAAAHGPIFEADGYLVTLTAHDDPTGLIEIRSEMARLVTIELPASATNISVLSAPGLMRASTVSFTIDGEEARLILGTGSFNVTGTRVLAGMASPDLLVFKSVPPASTNKAEWRAVLDAISAGQVVAELDLVATSDGHWLQNPARYRIDVAAWPLAVRPREASVQVDTLRPGGAIVLFAFDPRTMPINGSAQISVSANGKALNRSDDPLTLFYTFDSVARNASYTLLPLPGTVMAVYLPSLAAVSIDIVSLPPAAPAPCLTGGGADAAPQADIALGPRTYKYPPRHRHFHAHGRGLRGPGLREGGEAVSLDEEGEGGPPGAQADRRTEARPSVQGSLQAIPEEDETRTGARSRGVAVGRGNVNRGRVRASRSSH